MYYDWCDYVFAGLIVGILLLLFVVCFNTINVEKEIHNRIQIKGSYLKYNNNYYKKISEDELDNLYFLMEDE